MLRLKAPRPAAIPLGAFEFSDLLPWKWGGAYCTAIRSIPVYRDIVQRFGCGADGKKKASDAIHSWLSTNKDPTGFIGTMGTEVAIDCLCGSQGGGDAGSGGDEKPWYTNPLVLAGLGVGVIGIAVAVAKSGNKKSKEA